MSLFQYLQLQPLEPLEDGSISDLDRYEEDEVLDLTQDPDGETLMRGWAEIEQAFHSDQHESN